MERRHCRVEKSFCNDVFFVFEKIYKQTFAFFQRGCYTKNVRFWPFLSPFGEKGKIVEEVGEGEENGRAAGR